MGNDTVFTPHVFSFKKDFSVENNENRKETHLAIFVKKKIGSVGFILGRFLGRFQDSQNFRKNFLETHCSFASIIAQDSPFGKKNICENSKNRKFVVDNSVEKRYNEYDNYLIKSGGGTGPMKPRQPPTREGAISCDAGREMRFNRQLISARCSRALFVVFYGKSTVCRVSLD